MADVSPSTKRLLWYERLHEDRRHDVARPKDLRSELGHGSEVRLKESDHRLLPFCATRPGPVRRGVRERCNRPVHEASSRAAWQGYLADGRGRADRFVS